MLRISTNTKIQIMVACGIYAEGNLSLYLSFCAEKLTIEDKKNLFENYSRNNITLIILKT